MGKMLKTDSRVLGRPKGDRHVDFFRDVFLVDEETGRFIRIGHRILFNSLLSETGVVLNNT